MVYGCDDYLWGLYHIENAYMLSRTKHVLTSSWESARDAALSVGYSTDDRWGLPNGECGFSRSFAGDESYVWVLNSLPDFDRYY